MMLMKLFFALLLILVVWQIADPDFQLSTKEVIVRKVPLMNVNYETIEAQSYLNKMRSAMDMQKLDNNKILTQAAKAHANYLVLNNESGHIETAKHRKFSAEKPFERAFLFGYMSQQVSENLSTHNYNAHESIDGLFSAIYHRFGFLSTTINEIGIAIAQDEFDSDKSAFVYVMGNSDINTLCKGESYTERGSYFKGCKDESHRIDGKEYMHAINYSKQVNPDIVVYPYDKQRGVPPVFYEEEPDPLPSHEVSGFPISVEFNDYFYTDVTLLSFSLYDREGTPVKVQPMDKETDPNQRFTANQFAIFPLKRLDYNEQYYVEIVYRVKGKIQKKKWSFYTTRIQEEFHIVDKLYDELVIEAKTSYVIYFPPVDEHDLLKNLQFPVEVNIQFLDHNTIKLTLIDEMSDELEEFTLDTGVKKLRLIVKR